ncbi:MAG: hypothetical protein SCALA702_07480 [Melioribacteraceae bacterium]|nr:MAG: hypothetical protein SCALA702_07480 [Melioribacteraceae bacterium]
MNRSDELINKYLDNELSEAESGELENLVQSDQEIHSELDRSAKLHSNLKLADHPFEPNLSRKVMDTILVKSAEKAEKNIIYGIIIFFAFSIAGLFYWLFNGVTDQTASVLPDVDLSFLSPVTEYYNRSIGFLNSAELPESTYILLAVGAVVTFYLLYEHHREVRTLIIKK